MTEETQTTSEDTATLAAVPVDAVEEKPALEVAAETEAAPAAPQAPETTSEEASPDAPDTKFADPEDFTPEVVNPNALRGVPAGPADHPRTAKG